MARLGNRTQTSTRTNRGRSQAPYRNRSQQCPDLRNGAINIDGSRVGTADGFGGGAKGTSGFAAGYEGDGFVASTQGRWPANVIHDGSDEVLEGFPESKGGAFPAKRGQAVNTSFASGQETVGGYRAMGDIGSAARFFYCAKASKSERNAGLEGLPEQEQQGSYKFRTDGSLDGKETEPKANIHPTVKPLALMRYLIKLVTPPRWHSPRSVSWVRHYRSRSNP